MPPILVHIDDPITPQKTEGESPQNANPPTAVTTADANVNPEQPSSYPAARPRAAAVPAPTPYLPPNPQLQPTRTTQPPPNGPPAPQPGAVPAPPTQQLPATAPSTIPPPPTAGSQTTQPQGPPYQMNIPSPQQNYAANYATNAVPPPLSRPGPTTLDYGAVPQSQFQQPSSRPEGYQQNVFAQEMSSAQRAGLDHQGRESSLASNLGLNTGATSSSNETVENAWNTVKVWANAAGSKLAETEEQIWKRINGET